MTAQARPFLPMRARNEGAAGVDVSLSSACRKTLYRQPFTGGHVGRTPVTFVNFGWRFRTTIR